MDGVARAVNHAGHYTAPRTQPGKYLSPRTDQRPRFLVQSLEEGRSVAPHDSDARKTLLDQIDLVLNNAAQTFARLVAAAEYVVYLRCLNTRDLVSRQGFRFRVENRAV